MTKDTIKLKSAQYYQDNRIELLKKRKEYYEKVKHTPEFKKKSNERAKRFQEKNRERVIKQRREAYNISMESLEYRKKKRAHSKIYYHKRREDLLNKRRERYEEKIKCPVFRENKRSRERAFYIKNREDILIKKKIKYREQNGYFTGDSNLRKPNPKGPFPNVHEGYTRLHVRPATRKEEEHTAIDETSVKG